MLTIRERIDQFLSWGWDPAQHDANVMRRVRTLALVGTIGIGMLIPFLVRSFYWQIPLRMITQPFSVVLLAMALRILYTRHDMLGIERAARVMGVALALAGLGGMLTTGGLGTAAQGWLMLVPLLAAVTVSLRAALWWTFICYGAVAVIGGFQITGGHIANVTPSSFQRFEALFQSTAVFLGLALLLSAFISQLVYAEEANREKQRRLIEEMADRQKAEHDALLAEQSKNRFLASMGSEMRTPLNVLQGMIPRLEKTLLERLGERERMAFLHIGENVSSLMALTEDIFEFAALESGTLTLNYETVDILQLLASVQRQLEPEGRRYELAVTVQEGGSLMVRADVRRLQHAVINIVRHSLQYLEKGGVTLSLRPHEPGRLEIRVSDTGPSLTPEQRRLLFERDNPAPAVALRATGATSLGMVVARGLVEMHGGDLACEASAEGNRYTIVLPVNAVPS